jgi:hypothetical protein
LVAEVARPRLELEMANEAPNRGEGLDLFVIYTHSWLEKFGPLLNTAARRAYDTLAMYFGPRCKGIVWPKQTTVAQDMARTSRTTVIKGLDRLEELGLIERLAFRVPDPLGRRGRTVEVPMGRPWRICYCTWIGRDTTEPNDNDPRPKKSLTPRWKTSRTKRRPPV